jgi:signal transduction histidine kinase
VVNGEPEQRRSALLEQYAVLTEPPGRDLQALVELAAQLCEVPTAALNIVTRSHQHQIATTGVDPSVCAREDSMCAAVLDNRSAVVTSDAREDARFRDNPFVNGELGKVRFYGSAPLVVAGTVVGRLCVFDEEVRDLSAAQADGLRALADRVVDVLELRLRSRELEESLAELTAARDQLEASNRRLAEFASQMSHDLRTPLTAMLLNVEIAAEDPAVTGHPQVRDLLEAAARAGHRLSGFMESVLEAAQVQALLRPERVELDALVATVLDDLAPALAERGGRVETEPLPAVTADRAHLYSVLLNLLSNALKYVDPAVAPRVRISGRRVAGGWRVEVTDNGVGVPDHLAEQVFAPYVRGETDVAGTGIGLATCRQVVEAHDGRIGLLPAPGGGTTVWFELPG